uniref:c-type cytochrome n=1 Tax=Ningiella ruwaisensis TaxID=2364274 RepID=UPI00109EE441|nr:c-type cytochrome [Ningiella ruwaisensis]
MKSLFYLSFLSALLFLTACDSGVDSPRGFSLPEGDADRGKSVFIKYQCLSCHSAEGYEAVIKNMPSELDARVPLGGNSMRVTTYAELVTSIINPSHRISRGFKPINQDDSGNSTMRNYNQEMSVQELIDLVAYLQPQYKVKPYTYTTYNSYFIH